MFGITEFDLDSAPGPVFKNDHCIAFQTVGGSEMFYLSADPICINAKVPDTEVLEQGSEGLQIGKQPLLINAECCACYGRIYEIPRIRSTDGGF